MEEVLGNKGQGGLKSPEGEWEGINLRTCMHVCITLGHRQQGGEGLGQEAGAD